MTTIVQYFNWSQLQSNFYFQFQQEQTNSIMASTSRPVRNRNQPERNKDNIELNLELIEKLEANRVNLSITKAAKSTSSGNTNFAKIFASFINSVNESYRASLSKIQDQKKQHAALRNKSTEGGEQQQWGSTREKRKYVMGSSIKSYAKNPVGSQSLQQKERQKQAIQSSKQIRQSRPQAPQQAPQTSQQARNPQKQPKKTQLSAPQSSIPSPSSLTPAGPMQPKKPFKRASFHIGIAYTIYMQQIRDKNTNMADPRLCDPTIYAKKLKAEHNQN